MTPADTPTLPTITVTTGPAAGRSVQIVGELIIGREHAELTIADAELSRRHAVVRATSDGVVIEDLGSLNGTFINDKRISAATTLSPDDGIRMGASWLKLVLPPPPPSAPDPTPILDTETTRQRPVPTSDATPIIDTDTTRQRPVPTSDPTPILDTETTRQRPVPTAPDPTPIIDTDTTRQRPIPTAPEPTTPDPAPIIDTDTTRQRPVPTSDPTPIIDTETTRQRPIPTAAAAEGTVMRQTPAVQSERTTVSPVTTEGAGGPPATVDGAPAEGDTPPPSGRARGLPASVVTIIALVVIVASVGIALASNLKSSKSTHPVSATINATVLRAPQLGQIELTGTQQGGILGSGPTAIDEFLSIPGTTGPGSQLMSARITSHLPAGTLTTVVKANVTPRPGGGSAIAGTGTVTGGTSSYKHATGTYSVTGTQASPSGATILTLRGSISY